MNNIIPTDFKQEKEGYILDGKEVDGVYVGDLAAFVQNKKEGLCVVGHKENSGLVGQVVTMEEMNRFCLMWLAAFDPEVL